LTPCEAIPFLSLPNKKIPSNAIAVEGSGNIKQRHQSDIKTGKIRR
jgi:hypothetical protein